jgi:hypothetical protein
MQLRHGGQPAAPKVKKTDPLGQTRRRNQSIFESSPQKGVWRTKSDGPKQIFTEEKKGRCEEDGPARSPAAHHRDVGWGNGNISKKLRSCWLAKWSSPLSEREIQEIQEHEREIQEIQEHEREIQEIEIWTKKTVWINQYKNQWNPSQQGECHSHPAPSPDLQHHATMTEDSVAPPRNQVCPGPGSAQWILHRAPA